METGVAKMKKGKDNPINVRTKCNAKYSMGPKKKSLKFSNLCDSTTAQITNFKHYLQDG